METDYNDLINLAGADGHSFGEFLILFAIDYGIGESYTSALAWRVKNDGPVFHGFINPIENMLERYEVMPSLNIADYIKDNSPRILWTPDSSLKE